MSSVLLKLKDSAAPVELQEMSTTEENYLAYQVGLGFTTLDSSDVGQLGIDLSGSYNTVGTLTDTYLDSAVGTHNNLFTITTVDSIVKQETGTVAITDSDYRIPVFQKDSDGQRIIREMNDTELDAIADRINSRIYLSDYPGTYKLATSAPSGDYTEYLSSVTTDTRTDGTALPYNLYRRTSMTAPTVIRPFAIKRRGGVERINGSSNSAITQGGMSIVQGEWYQLDVDVVHTGGNDLVKFYMNDGSGMGNINVSRSGSGHLTHTFRATATATIEFRVSFGTDFRGYIMNTSMRKVLTSGGKTRLDANLITNSTFDTDTSGWAINAIPNTYRWIDGRVERYNGSGNSPITQYIDIVDGEWYQVDWDVDYDSGDDQTNLWIDIGDGQLSASHYSHMYGDGHATRYFRAAETKSMLFRLYTIGDFRGYLDNVTVRRVNTALGPNMITNSTFENDLNGWGSTAADFAWYAGGTTGTYRGLQEMTDDQIKYSLGLKSRNRTSTANSVGSYRIFSSIEGTPSQNALSGTWVAKGTATDTRQVIDDQSYARSRESTYTWYRDSTYNRDYTRTRESNYLRNSTRVIESTYSRNYTRVRTSMFSTGFVGDYAGNQTASDKNFESTYTGDFTGNYAGDYNTDYTGDYGGNYTNTYNADYQRDDVTDFQRTSTRISTANYNVDYTGNYTGNYAGNYTGNYIGDYVRHFTGDYSGATSTRVSSSNYTGNISRSSNFTGNYQGTIAGYYTTIDTQTVTVGGAYTTFGVKGIITSFPYIAYGYHSANAVFNLKGDKGSINDGTCNFLSGNNISKVIWVEKQTNAVKHVEFRVEGTHAAASFDTMKIHNTTFNRSDATHSQQAATTDAFGNAVPATTTWEWNTNTNPFPSEGSDASVVWKNYTAPTYPYYSRTSTAYYSGTRTSTAYYTGNYSGNYAGNYANNYTRDSQRDDVTDFQRTSTRISTGAYTNAYTGNYTGNYAGNYTGNYIANYSIDYITHYANNYTDTYITDYTRNTEIDYIGDFLGATSNIDTYTGNYSGNYLTHYTGDYIGDYLGGDFLGEYTGDYTATYEGNYTAAYEGNYSGQTITSGSQTIETYTMYVRAS